MSFNNKKLNLNLKINHILWFVFIFILIFTFINLVSAAEVDETSITNDNTLIVTGNDDLSQYEKDVLSMRYKVLSIIRKVETPFNSMITPITISP